MDRLTCDRRAETTYRLPEVDSVNRGLERTQAANMVEPKAEAVIDNTGDAGIKARSLRALVLVASNGIVVF